MTYSPDPTLLTRATGGDREALSQLLNETAPALHAKLEGEIHTRWQGVFDVDDVLQVTFLEVFLRIEAFENRGPGSWHAWIQRVAKHNLIDAIRSLEAAKQLPPEKRVYAAHSAESSWALLDELGKTTGTPSRFVATEEEHQRLRSAVERLPRDYGQVITLYDLEARSVDEVGRIMKRSKGAVYMLRARALDFLRETMGA